MPRKLPGFLLPTFFESPHFELHLPEKARRSSEKPPQRFCCSRLPALAFGWEPGAKLGSSRSRVISPVEDVKSILKGERVRSKAPLRMSFRFFMICTVARYFPGGKPRPSTPTTRNVPSSRFTLAG